MTGKFQLKQPTGRKIKSYINNKKKTDSMDAKTKTALIITSAILILDMVLYKLKPLGENFYIISDWAVVIFAFAAVALGYYAYRLHGIKTSYGEALLFLVLGSLFWAFGELFWALLETVLKMEPFPSIADMFWYAGYFLFGMGLYYIWKATRTSVPGHRVIAAVLTVLAALAISIFYGVFPSIIDPGLTLMEKIVTIGYVALDFMIIVWEIIIIVSLLGRELIKPWVVILIAGFVTTFADIMFAQIASLYESGSFFGVLWDVQYILMAFGFFYYRQAMSGMPKKAVKKKIAK
ncbi:hypothetical protein HYU09_02490 [Candidatus Woesearchaeota archaeon]|nr:hypothetical protein [Candidatus Woesearchaeota archaeon]